MEAAAAAETQEGAAPEAAVAATAAAATAATAAAPASSPATTAPPPVPASAPVPAPAPAAPAFGSEQERRAAIATALQIVATASLPGSASTLVSFPFKVQSAHSLENFVGARATTLSGESRSLVLLTLPLMCFMRREGCPFSGFSYGDEATFRSALARQLHGLLGVLPTWRKNHRNDYAIYLD
jgi:hypothetical protein